MQQKLCSRGSGSFLLQRNSPACGAVTDLVTSCDLPFRCPRCGEKERFCSLASLRAHLEKRHSYRSPDLITGSFSITGKLPDPLTAAIPWHDMSLPARRGHHSVGRLPHARSLSDSRDSGYLHSYGSARRRTQSVGVGTQAEDEDEAGDGDEKASGDEDAGEEEERDAEHRDEARQEEETSIKKTDTSQHHPFALSASFSLEPDQDMELVGTFRLLLL